MQTTDKSMAPLADELSKAFSKLLVGAESLRVDPLSGDASSRRYFRIWSEGKSYVLQENEPFLDSALKTHPYLSSLQLYQQLGLPVPRFLGVAPERGWILLDDLKDKTLQAEPTTTKYKEALGLLIDLVLSSEKFISQNLDAQYKGPHFSWAFDSEKLSQEMAHTALHLVDKYYSLDAAEFVKCLQPTVDYLSSRPRVLCHRDYHCRNLMDFEGRLWMIDFQDTRMGPLSYDVVSLLWDPYAQLRSLEKKELLDFWRKSVESAAKTQSLDRILSILDTPRESQDSFECELARTQLQRLLKAAGSYASFLNLKGRTDYLPSIKPALMSAREAVESILKEKNWAVSEDERLLTLIDDFINKESAIINQR